MKTTDEFSGQNIEQSLKELQTDGNSGLNKREAAARLFAAIRL